MQTTTTTAYTGTTATAVTFTYAPAVAADVFSMWSSPATKHSNKRFARRPRGGSIS